MVSVCQPSNSTKWLKHSVELDKLFHEPKELRMSIEKETEEKIFQAAQTIFQKRGFEGARMQEIADEAGINKSMLHYYYRSKDNLFLEVFKAGVKKVFPRVLGILSSGQPLSRKVEEIVNFYHEMYEQNPHLPSFVVYEMNQHPDRFKTFMQSMNISLPKIFMDQVNEGIKEGKIMPMHPTHFFLNVVSMCMMPMVARTMVQTIFSLDDGDYSELLEERKSMIPHIIWKGVRP